MALDFPASPNINDTYTFGGVTWTWDGTTWKVLGRFQFISSETDPIFTASPAFNILQQNITNWNLAYGWGDHSTSGYLTSTGSLNSHTDVNLATLQDGQLLKFSASSNKWENWSPNYLTSYTETDPVFVGSPAFGIDSADISNWNTAYGWGNHSTAGYLTSYTETDPVFAASPAGGITESNISNWNESYNWGNHNTSGYITSESDTLSSVVSRGNSTTSSIGVGGISMPLMNFNVDSFNSSFDFFAGGANTKVNLFLGTGGKYSIRQNAPAGSNEIAFFNAGGNVELYYAYNKKFETTATGVTITGNLNFTGNLLQNGSAFSPLQSRTTAQATTTSIANGASTYIAIAVAKTYALLKIGTTHASWIRLYTDELSRSSDSTRLQGVDPSPSSGVISEIITTGAEEIRLTPATIGWNDNIPASTNVYISVKNLSGQSAAITVTLTYIKLEN